MDLSEVIDAYLVESEELLRDMENILLRIESQNPNEEDLNAIFRAAHTIKGTAGMFGFDSTVKFTHVVENLLDGLRSKSITFQKKFVEILLTAKDHLTYLVTTETNGPIPKEKLEFGESILKQIYPYTNQENTETEKEDTNKSENIESDKFIVQNVNGTRFVLISFRPNQNVFLLGFDPMSFISYLKKLGKIKYVKTIDTFLETNQSFDPEQCYLGFEIVLDTRETLDTIRNAFSFIEADSFLHILPKNSSVSELVDLATQLPEEEIYLGNLWKEMGLLSENELVEYFERLKNENDSETVAITKTSLNQIQNSPQKNPELDQTSKQSTIRVDSKRIDSLINRVGELVVSCANMNQQLTGTEDPNLIESSILVMRLLNEVREISLKLRMVPIGDLFQKYQRIIRDLSKELGKEISLVIEGKDTELDRNIVEKLGDPLTHLIRNACDHGMETPEERIKKGKPKAGIIHLNAYHEGGSIVIEVADDGAGINKKKVLSKAKEKGIITAAIQDSEDEIYKLLFHPGFSTADKVTNVSGRGVGLDVVNKNIESLRGIISIRSKENEGSKFILRLPLTLAIIDGFLVGIGKNRYIIPMEMILECLDFSEENETKSNQYFALRGNLIPYIRLNDYFPSNEDTKSGERENIVIVRNGEKKAGIVVDRLFGEYQTVIRPMGSVFHHVKGVSGTSILADGSLALILDVNSLFDHTIALETEFLLNKRG
ncbi:chemotaxis protein CheA [Leptospira sp. 96542]|nr:chemotaxis protein CheA [Leptospira sp. 96542]